jgi:hypothetical protein
MNVKVLGDVVQPVKVYGSKPVKIAETVSK